MTAPIRLQLSRAKGFNLQAHSHAINGLAAVNCARPGKWGNPFIIGKEFIRRRMEPGGGEKSNIVFDADHAVRLFRRFTSREVIYQINSYRELHGKNLACWCALDQPCHVDTLLELANHQSK